MNKYTLHTVKSIKTIAFGCETESLIAVLTLYGGFHVYFITTLISPPANDTIHSTFKPKWGMHSWYLSVVGKGGVLGDWPGRQWGQGRLCGGSQLSDFLWSWNAGGTFHCWCTSSLQNVMHKGEMDAKELHSAFLVCWKILIDYYAINKCCLQNPIEKWIPIASESELYIIIG